MAVDASAQSVVESRDLSVNVLYVICLLLSWVWVSLKKCWSPTNTMIRSQSTQERRGSSATTSSAATECTIPTSQERDTSHTTSTSSPRCTITTALLERSSSSGSQSQTSQPSPVQLASTLMTIQQRRRALQRRWNTLRAVTSFSRRQIRRPRLRGSGLRRNTSDEAC